MAGRLRWQAVAWAVVLMPALWPQESAAQPTQPAARPQGAAGQPFAFPDAADQSLGAQGLRLAAQGAPEQGIAACASCHGAQGEGMAASGFPRLAGQSPAYLVRQIDSFAQGTRTHPLMSPIAKAMTLEQSMASAFYYATLEPDSAAETEGRPAAALASPAPAASEPGRNGAASQDMAPDRGQRLANAGDEAAQIPACANCHGLQGRGEPPAYPYLAGQHASYLINSLAQWKNGQRKNDPTGQMQAIASRLSEADIAAVAAYYASQRPPSRHPGIHQSSPPPRKIPGGRGPAAQPLPEKQPPG